VTDRGSSVYSAFIAGLLADEERHKDSLEARGLAVITTSGVLASLLFGFVATLAGTNAFALPSSADDPLVAAAALFILAASLGILTNVPFLYKAVKPSSLALGCRELWADQSGDAELMVASTQVNLYASVRSANTVKAVLLMAAFTAEVAALVPLLIAVVYILNAHN
jgi:hypothetical protein